MAGGAPRLTIRATGATAAQGREAPSGRRARRGSSAQTRRLCDDHRSIGNTNHTGTTSVRRTGSGPRRSRRAGRGRRAGRVLGPARGRGRARLLGVATSQFRWAAGLVIPLETARRAAAAIARHGRIARGYLGVSSQQVPLPEALAQRLGLTQESALLIVGVQPGAPADRAGLMIGDVLVALAGQPVRSTEDLLALLGP